MSEVFIHRPEIRWSDQDILGHVNNGRIVTLIEEGRINWLVGMRGRDSISAPKLAVRMELDYRKPVMYGPELTLELRIARVGSTSFTIHTTGIQEDAVVFEALNVMVTVDPETMRPTPISEKDKDYLRTYMADAGD